MLQTDGKGFSSRTVAFAKWALQALASSSRMRRGTRAARAVDIRATSSRETGKAWALMTKPASARLQRHTVTRVCSTCGQHTGRGCLPLVCSLQQSMAGKSYNHMRCWTDHDADAAALPAQTLHHSMLGVPCQEQASQGGPSCFARGAAASSRPRAGDSSWTWLKLLKGHSTAVSPRVVEVADLQRWIALMLWTWQQHHPPRDLGWPATHAHNGKVSSVSTRVQYCFHT